MTLLLDTCALLWLAKGAPSRTMRNKICFRSRAIPTALDIDILANSCALPGQPPNDPADRIIIATARESDMTIVTRDHLILDYARAGHVRAMAC
jgi:PIN domain nuclease of toxin-antitoxin system